MKNLNKDGENKVMERLRGSRHSPALFATEKCTKSSWEQNSRDGKKSERLGKRRRRSRQKKNEFLLQHRVSQACTDSARPARWCRTFVLSSFFRELAADATHPSCQNRARRKMTMLPSEKPSRKRRNLERRHRRSFPSASCQELTKIYDQVFALEEVLLDLSRTSDVEALREHLQEAKKMEVSGSAAVEMAQRRFDLLARSQEVAELLVDLCDTNDVGLTVARSNSVDGLLAEHAEKCLEIDSRIIKTARDRSSVTRR